MISKEIKKDRNRKGQFVKGNKAATPGHKIYTDAVICKLTHSLLDWVDAARKAKKLVLLIDWCLDNKVTETQLGRLVRKSEQFAYAHEIAKMYQSQVLQHGGLTKRYDSKFCSFFLATRHGWTHDKAREDKEETQKSHLEEISAALREDHGDEE